MGTGGRSQLEIVALSKESGPEGKAPEKASLSEKWLRRAFQRPKVPPHLGILVGIAEEARKSSSFQVDLEDWVRWQPAFPVLQMLSSISPDVDLKSGILWGERQGDINQIAFYGPTVAGYIGAGRGEILLENERLKTQLIAEQRAVLAAREHNAQLSSHISDLNSQSGVLLDGVCELAKANKALQAVLIAKSAGRLCFHEEHLGLVTGALGDQVEVTYETGEGRLKQVYSRAQFIHGKFPQEGDAVEAHVLIAVGKASEAKTESEETSDLPEFRTKGISGTIRI
jgi:hypothetical protein